MTTETTKLAKMPPLKELGALVRHVKSHIADEYRAFEGDETPGIQLTVAWNPETGDWDYQTGDNSYTGAAYCYPVWAVVGVYRRSNSVELARDIQGQLYDQA